MGVLEKLGRAYNRFRGYQLLMQITRSVCTEERKKQEEIDNMLRKTDTLKLKFLFESSSKICPKSNNFLRFDYFFRVRCDSGIRTCEGGWAYINGAMKEYLDSRPYVYFVPSHVIPKFVDIRETKQSCFVDRSFFEKELANRSLDDILVDIPKGEFEIDVPVISGRVNSNMIFYPDVHGKCCDRAKVLMRIKVEGY